MEEKKECSKCGKIASFRDIKGYIRDICSGCSFDMYSMEACEEIHPYINLLKGNNLYSVQFLSKNISFTFLKRFEDLLQIDIHFDVQHGFEDSMSLITIYNRSRGLKK